jgi:hypothetical protein
MLVQEILKSLGAPDNAVSWAADYGDDIRRAWNECEHPELLLPLAVGIGVPSFDVINACIEVVDVNLSCMRLDWDNKSFVINPAVEKGLKLIERFICDEADSGEVVVVLQTMGRLSQEIRGHAQRSSFGSVAHTGEAALLGRNGHIIPMMSKLSTAVMLSAQARAETIACGSTDRHKSDLIDATLKGTAPLVRRYIPYESFLGGVISAIMMGHPARSHIMGDTYNEEFPYA